MSRSEPAAHRISGFVDLQINGGFGHDFTTRPESIWEVASRLPEHGVTAFLPTIVSSKPETTLAALRVMASGPPEGWVGARPLGLHLEGPFLAPDRRGTHPSERLLAPDLDLVERWIATGPPLMVTLAPELPGANDVVVCLQTAGVVVALGHSACTADVADQALDSGATHVTHLFNGMSGLDHRSPGLAAAVLTHPTVTAGLIADGIHVHPTMLRLAHRILGSERIALVTDAIAALGMGNGTYELGDVPITVVGPEVRNEAGALAGSAASMPHMVRTMRTATGVSAAEVLAMATATPARIVGFKPGSGDEVLLDDDFDVISTTINDTVVYLRDT